MSTHPSSGYTYRYHGIDPGSGTLWDYSPCTIRSGIDPSAYTNSHHRRACHRAYSDLSMCPSPDHKCRRHDIDPVLYTPLRCFLYILQPDICPSAYMHWHHYKGCHLVWADRNNRPWPGHRYRRHDIDPRRYTQSRQHPYTFRFGRCQIAYIHSHHYK